MNYSFPSCNHFMPLIITSCIIVLVSLFVPFFVPGKVIASMAIFGIFLLLAVMFTGASNVAAAKSEKNIIDTWKYIRLIEFMATKTKDEPGEEDIKE